MHLKVTSVCCDRLAAAGLRRAEPQQGLTWRHCRDDLALCPPRKTGAAPLCARAANRKWLDVPEMEVAYQRALDWLVVFEGSCLGDIALGVHSILKQFAFYVDEYRLIWQRLSESSRVLVLEEELNIWTAVGAARLFRFLDEQAVAFETHVMVQLPETYDCKLDWKDENLFDPQFWLRSRVQPTPAATRTLHIGLCVQGTTSSAATVMVPKESLLLWFKDKWQVFDHIFIDVTDRVEEEALFRCRYLDASSLDTASSCAVIARVLLVGLEAWCEGSKVSVQAPADFWDQPSSLPFLPLRFVSPN